MLKIKHQASSIKKIGFTLVELLVSLGVLGLILTLTLPQLYISQDKIKKKALFKEAYNTVAVAYQQAAFNGEFFYDDPMKYINASKVCDTNSTTQGCIQSLADYQAWNAGTAHDEYTNEGLILHSGVGLLGFQHQNANNMDPINNPGQVLGDGLVIALENFPKKEYFYLLTNLAEVPRSTNDFEATLPWFDYSPHMPAGVSARTGEIKCSHPECLDMLK